MIKESKYLKNINDKLKFKIRPNTTDIKVIDEVVNRNVYEKSKMKFFLKDKVWLDLGGNIGTFALMALINNSKVYSYEPEKDNYELLKYNINLNKKFYKLKNIKTFKKAVSYKQSNEKLYLCNGEYNKYRHSLIPIRGRNNIINLKTLALKDILKKYKDINSIKMDIEGSEIDILKNFKSWKNIEQLVFEYSFDIDKSIPNFIKIIKKLKKYFKTVYLPASIKTSIRKKEKFYNYFPSGIIIFCKK